MCARFGDEGMFHCVESGKSRRQQLLVVRQWLAAEKCLRGLTVLTAGIDMPKIPTLAGGLSRRSGVIDDPGIQSPRVWVLRVKRE